MLIEIAIIILIVIEEQLTNEQLLVIRQFIGWTIRAIVGFFFLSFQTQSLLQLEFIVMLIMAFLFTLHSQTL